MIKLKNEWTLTVDTIELRLILKALGGRLKDDDAVAAKKLGDNLSMSRANATKHAMAEADKLLANLGEGL